VTGCGWSGQLPAGVTEYKSPTGMVWLARRNCCTGTRKDSTGAELDGSKHNYKLTIYIQKDAPSADKKSNWLPAPDGPIFMVMRLYWPKTEPPSILPAGEGTWQPPAIQVAQ